MNTYHEIEHAPRGVRTLLMATLIIYSVVVGTACFGVATELESSIGEVLGFVGAAVVLPSVLIVLLLRTTLEVTVDESGLSIIMRPFHRKVRHYAWAEIAEISTRRVSPLGEFGGWGIRGWGKKVGYIWAGNTGIDVLTTNGKRIVVSITNAESAREAIEKNRPAVVR